MYLLRICTHLYVYIYTYTFVCWYLHVYLHLFLYLYSYVLVFVCTHATSSPAKVFGGFRSATLLQACNSSCTNSIRRPGSTLWCRLMWTLRQATSRRPPDLLKIAEVQACPSRLESPAPRSWGSPGHHSPLASREAQNSGRSGLRVSVSDVLDLGWVQLLLRRIRNRRFWSQGTPSRNKRLIFVKLLSASWTIEESKLQKYSPHCLFFWSQSDATETMCNQSFIGGFESQPTLAMAWRGSLKLHPSIKRTLSFRACRRSCLMKRQPWLTLKHGLQLKQPSLHSNPLHGLVSTFGKRP